MPQGRSIHDELREKFPQMRPISSPPSLGSLNGFGLSMSGEHDADPATGTYIKTKVFTAQFIPILALAAYRVADAETGGWYFLGREKLSGFAKFWNLLLVFGCIGVFAGSSIIAERNSPEYAAKQEITKAQGLEAEGKFLAAANIYANMLDGDTALVQLRDKIRSADLNFDDEMTNFKTSISGKDDAETLKESQTAHGRYAERMDDKELAESAVGW
ncbi:MAG: hypothetical protein ACI8XO_004998 [Verrucomicrobiales bacterium]|jgi:hypothetical protein